ncbi:phosphoglycerol transferase MdoB-like AlkP superfamily enzyme [Sedimentibacter acidaminivorans]|uniref:Phosphoglycerol transferase MdoB-like AlkP superfamily enzyme n=1 Tax=Sedimentibacter acidaminivorans TaxID=913099 RepID=A0ABS4G9I6_9FIRM|nr:hypothetical protein [Sedimentibacter acidaminivorans]MBP1924358.1 phosphoglycerol transferase MdoB-like AlkP superfamily enzyme [Sedimentibacter acidaminivorans]
MFNDFMTMDILTTFAGLTGAVMLIVQFTKSIVKNKLGDSFVRLYSFIIALILTFVFARQGNQVQDIILTIINAIMITMASAGGYEIVSDPLARKAKK